MTVLFKKIRNKIFWLIEDITWFVYKPFYKARSPITDITIGITTFMDRYQNCLKPLLKKIAILFPESQIIVMANGHVKQREQEMYLNEIKTYCEKFSNVKLVTFENPRGLSYLWNKIIEFSICEKVLVLNDDLKIKKGFYTFILESLSLNAKIAVINNSWSHFFINKEIIMEIGPFDEGLLEIGGEDDDYAARLALNNIPISQVTTNTITGKLKFKQKQLKINSYGRDMRSEINGYSSTNNMYLINKWIMSDKYFEGATEVPNRSIRYWKLR
jgi:hypothetical protein